eukprot:Nk52_evm107s352 gene=Nk52_evmTU107s352
MGIYTTARTVEVEKDKTEGSSEEQNGNETSSSPNAGDKESGEEKSPLEEEGAEATEADDANNSASDAPADNSGQSPEGGDANEASADAAPADDAKDISSKEYEESDEVKHSTESEDKSGKEKEEQTTEEGEGEEKDAEQPPEEVALMDVNGNAGPSEETVKESADSTLNENEESVGDVLLSSKKKGIMKQSQEKKVFLPTKPLCIPFITKLIGDTIELGSYDKTTMWDKEAVTPYVETFLTNPDVRMLVAYVEEVEEKKEVRLLHHAPSYETEEWFYFIRKENSQINHANFFSEVQFASAIGSSMHPLLDTMSGVYNSLFQTNYKWPDSVFMEYTGQFHKYMAFLTDAANQLKGNTVLYIPKDSFESVEEACASKTTVLHLESVLIHWTRQIKEVLSNQEKSDFEELSGPLEEISFWRDRCFHLEGIGKQLDNEKVQTIQTILEISKSSYVEPFTKLSRMIQEGYLEAESNLKFLTPLQDPCKELAEAEPKQIPEILPQILQLVYVIGVNSQYYNSKERLTGLLRKVSNEIINRCCAKISLDEIFDGDIYAALETLQESIACGEAWRKIYDRTRKLLVQHGYIQKEFCFATTSVFAQIDAFVQRCRDLIEVCEGQIQFARKTSTGKAPMPVFGGAKGLEIVGQLTEIELSFEKTIVVIKDMRKTVLDVKSTTWQFGYNKFKQGVKDLEIMFQNVINTSFESNKSVEMGVQLLDIFHGLANKDAIKRTVDKKAMEIFTLFNDDLNIVKKDFDYLKRNPDLPFNFPKFAGAAMWARFFKARIESPMKTLDGAYYLGSYAVAEDARKQYHMLSNALDEYINRTYNEWATELDPTLIKRLESTLLCRSPQVGNSLELKFDNDLTRLFVEVKYWEKLRFEIPYSATEIYSKREELRILREHVLLVVRDYNNIVTTLSTEERYLFRERIRFLDRKVSPGLTKLNWASKGISEYFVKECRNHSKNVQQLVTDFKGANHNLSKICRKINNSMLVSISPKHIYSEEDFEKQQLDHMEATKAILLGLHQEAVTIMWSVFEFFKADGAEIYNQWKKYCLKIDKAMESAFRTTVKKSLLELSRAINGDGKMPPNPLFQVNVVLEKQVEYRPSMKTIEKMVIDVGNSLIKVIDLIPRIPEQLKTATTEEGDSMYDKISKDEEIVKSNASILSGIVANMAKCQSYLANWDRYKEVWEISKDAFIRRYAKLKPPLGTFDADIARYGELSNNIQKEETITQVSFILLDCSNLKIALASHCSTWQNKFTSLLNQMALDELKEMHSHLVQSAVTLRKEPQTLSDLGDGITYLSEMQTYGSSIEEKFGPLHEKYQILEKYDVTIEEDEKVLLEELQGHWSNFQSALVDSDLILKQCRERFKASLLHSMEEFNKNIESMKEDFSAKAPFDASAGPEKALEWIDQFRSRMDTTTTQEAQYRKELLIFKIDQPRSKEIAILEKDLDLMTQIWKLCKEWESSWNSWKSTTFKELDSTKMEEAAQVFQKKSTKLQRQIPDWDVATNLKTKVDQFKRTMPLVQDLKNPAIRDRHWNQLCEEIQKPFDPKADDFNLEKLIELGLDQFVVNINNISAAASKELSMEQALQGISEAWSSIEYETAAYKDNGHFKMKSTDDVSMLLEDNQVTLSSMKASKFVKPFEKDVDSWERTLSLIMETTEQILNVQRQWMYLENIFTGEDIRKQLPTETSVFDEINVKWKKIMTDINSHPSVLRTVNVNGLLDTLNEMNNQLENIQKSLDMYLETKRQVFPRFYFISNDDLLEILGQAKNPTAVQPHMRKCFDNIKSLELGLIGQNNRRYNEALGMYSSDGEHVPFNAPVLIEGPVELWLCEIEIAMRSSLRKQLPASLQSLKKSKRHKWLKDWAGQLCIAASQILWTNECIKALMLSDKNDKKPLKSHKKKQISTLNKMSDLITGQLTKVMRLKLIALVTIEVHARDVVEKMIKAGCNDVNDFEWLSQLRFQWDKEEDDCLVRQTNTLFRYGYEYLGNSGRLVITPLTDRCYMTLTTALHLYRGGSPQGPAGTGKTETVKDLGKSLGFYVIVINCSEGLDYKSMGRMFSGLAQTGAWGCFDEFNRINIEVLSVVAQQIHLIQSSLAARNILFNFEGYDIRLFPTVGIFITMNPGYAGRTELPDNLKSKFRPVSMMVPDTAMIAEITLFAEGFTNTKILAKKVDTLYKLSVQQLSKQDHYDFGLRALTSALRTAGAKKRLMVADSDDATLLLALKTMNIPKLTSNDVPLFNGMLSDLFPSLETPVIDFGELKAAIEEDLIANNYQIHPALVESILQFHETKKTRHSVMIVGLTGSGKSVCWKTLQNSVTKLAKAGKEDYFPVKIFPLNPKALSLGELYGEFDLATSEWSDGVLSNVMRTVCSDEKTDEKWVLLDGPVDTLWIESMNSVMDDNKVLTLINGERINLPDPVSLVFEVEDLAVASPATVSRTGMIYMDLKDMGWRPFINSWLQGKEANLRELLEKHIENLFDALTSSEENLDSSDIDTYARLVELWFLFSSIWSIGGSIDEESRKLFDNFLREIEGQFPSKDSVFEYCVEPRKRAWAPWEEKISSGWRYQPNTPFHKIIVPTIDTLRYDFLMRNLLKHNSQVLLVGPVGTGKTAISQAVVQTLDPAIYNTLTINMSAQTSSNSLQHIIESRVEKRTKEVFVPIGGKSLLVYIDDLNMPQKDLFGSQPPLELLRLWQDYGFWYDRAKQTSKYIRDMHLVASMGPPGGGRTTISRRFQSRFNLIAMNSPSEQSIIHIFSSLIGQKLQDFEEDVKPLGEQMTQATYTIYSTISNQLLPTPAKIHYLFNMRDISKVFQGLLRANKTYHDTRESILKLWTHECYRVFHDRLINATDVAWFNRLISDVLWNTFQISFQQLLPSKMPPIFGDFMNDSSEENIYVEYADFNQLKSFLEIKLEDYGLEPGFVAMDLVLFRDAVEHITRVIRVIRQPRGNMLLVGVGGSGRQSLTKLAAFTIEYNVFQIEVTKNYRFQEFREDLKSLYFTSGVENKQTVFLFNDTQILEESFLEDIGNILGSGEVPSLHSPDEFEQIKSELESAAKQQGIAENNDALYSFFIDRVRSNLHIVLCMSPVGDPFRDRLRKFPSLINCTTIDWFSEWPNDALLEVASKYLDEGLGFEAEIVDKISEVFTVAHSSVREMSKKMLFEVKRANYVTPTNYLELVSGYKELVKEKKLELGNAAGKLRNGLDKLDDTRLKVETMSVELEKSKIQLAEFQKQCEEYLVVIVQQKREADETQKAVSVRSEKIAVEEKECKLMADAAQHDLDEAIPALEASVKALEALNKKDITEIKSYGKPPALVEKVLEAVMILRKSEPTWAEAKRHLGEPNFIQQLVNYDKDNMTDKILSKIGKYCALPDFQPDIIGRVSLAAKSLCLWVRAMETYGNVYRVVAPKRAKLNAASAALAEKQQSLAEAKANLKAISDKLDELQKEYADKMKQKEDLRKQAEDTEIKLERAQQLVDGLGGERERWEQSIAVLETNISYLPGDCLLAAGFLSYCGPFTAIYRHALIIDTWLANVKQLEIPCNPEFSFQYFLAKPTSVREWNIQGLPTDAFSVENGVTVTRGRRWPLMIDPQGQAFKWIKNMESERGLKLIDLQQPDYLRTLENCIQFGTPVLLQNVLEELDPSLDPILNKSIVKQGGRLTMRLGDKEIEYNVEFKFYITTKLSNPYYAPEISTKVTIVNFAVTPSALENQLLGTVVRKEKPELEEQKDALVVNIATAKNTLAKLEDEILYLLSTAQGSLLDDVKLVNTLQSSKKTSEEIVVQLKTSETTEVKIDQAREGYRPCAQRASILFFVLNDLGLIDPMYQFSLDAYISVFENSIFKSPRSHDVTERLVSLNDYHTYAVYKYACRGLFEAHKLLFSFQICTEILKSMNKLNLEEYQFFLRGGQVLDKELQVDNPCKSWLPEIAWDNITELDNLASFSGLSSSFEQYGREWKEWFETSDPETAPLPSDWGNKCNELERMLIVRSLRQDRVSFTVTSFIVNNLGTKYVEPPPLEMNSVLEDSTAKTPLIFVLSPGVNPSPLIENLAVAKGMQDKFYNLSLGQGQAPIATRMLKEGAKEGKWVFLANCHLSISWMPELSKHIEDLQVTSPHPDFRLWLSSSPHPDFPLSILQTGIKITTEPPKGIKANMGRLYSAVNDTSFGRTKAQHKYKPLLFSLVFFHSILLERRKFLTLGWNIPYDFNDSDFEVCENLLAIYLDEYEETPWDAIKYLIAEVNYGGRVTDDWDRRVLNTYINEFFCEAAISSQQTFKLSTLSTYYIPEEGNLQSYKDYVNTLPVADNPEAFGQHSNADIASQIIEARNLLGTLTSLQPQVSVEGGRTAEDVVLDLAGDIMKKLPEPIDFKGVQKLLEEDYCPLNVILSQEVERYNKLLVTMSKSLESLEKGIKGLVVMSQDLEETYDALFKAVVPKRWSYVYPSFKPLAAWTRDLIARVGQFETWSTTLAPPHCFWLAGFSFPTGFLTAVLQTSARRNRVSIDSLSWEFTPQSQEVKNISAPPTEGVFIHGLYLEGGGWNKQAGGCLCDPKPMELITPIPPIHFKPTEGKKKAQKGIYNCPCYYYTNRAGLMGQPSFVISIDIKSGTHNADHWVKRGTAFVLNLDN